MFNGTNPTLISDVNTSTELYLNQRRFVQSIFGLSFVCFYLYEISDKHGFFMKIIEQFQPKQHIIFIIKLEDI